MITRGLIIIAVSMSIFLLNLRTLQSEGEGAMAIRLIVVVGNLIGIALFYFGARIKEEERNEKSTKKLNVEPKNTVSVVSPSQKRELILSLVDGEYRYFHNYIINGIQYTYGFPKPNCSDKRVWVGRGTVEIERISDAEAQRRIGNLNVGSNR